MKRLLLTSGGRMGGVLLLAAMTGCCYQPAFISPNSGIPYGGRWVAAPGGPYDPSLYAGIPYDGCYTQPTCYPAGPANYLGMNPYAVTDPTIDNSFSVGAQPILPGNPFRWLLQPFGWLFGWGPWYTPYGYGYGYDYGYDAGYPSGEIIDGGCIGGPYEEMYYESVPPTYLPPDESFKPQPAPPAESSTPDSNPGTNGPVSMNAPLLSSP